MAMIHLVQDLSPILAIGIASGLILQLRSRAAARAGERTRQLNEAAEFLELHARTLDIFLGNPNAPRDLRALLLQCSEILDERESVARLTQWAAARRFDEPIDTEEIRAMGRELARLRERDAELADKFDAAVISAVAGASLRWPESASLFDYTFPRLVTTPHRDVAIAVIVSHLRPKAPFSIRSASPPVTALA